MALILETGLEPEKEYEADEHGVRYAIDAGYDPNGLEQFLCRLKNKKATNGDCKLKKINPNKKSMADAETEVEKTHPPIGERVAKINKILSDVDADTIIGAKGKRRYAKWRDKVQSAH